MNAFRKKMIARHENLGWCKPYFSKNGRVQFTINEGAIVSICVDKNEIVPAKNHLSSQQPEHFSEDTLKEVARMINERYDSLSDSEQDQMILAGEISEGACCECPWFLSCEAMDNRDGLESEEDENE